MKVKILPTKPLDYTEVIFTSRSGFSLACYSDKSVKGAWNLLIKVDKYNQGSNVLFGAEKLDQLLNLLQQAKQKILAVVLSNVIRLLHPMAPFITENLFQLLKTHFYLNKKKNAI